MREWRFITVKKSILAEFAKAYEKVTYEVLGDNPGYETPDETGFIYLSDKVTLNKINRIIIELRRNNNHEKVIFHDYHVKPPRKLIEPQPDETTP